MGKGKTIAAIDIGTEKVCTLIAQLGEGDREPHVVGVAAVSSKGLRKSQIVDLDEAIEAIADKALALKTGARGLRTIIESALKDVMFEIPSVDGVTKVVVTKDVIEAGSPVEMMTFIAS
jgi:hypothetical protein